MGTGWCVRHAGGREVRGSGQVSREIEEVKPPLGVAGVWGFEILRTTP